MYKKKNQLSELLICLVDMTVVIFSIFVAGMLRYRDILTFRVAENIQECLLIGILMHVVAFYYLRVHERFFLRDRYNEALLAVKYTLFVGLGMNLVGFCLKIGVFKARLMFGYFSILCAVLIWCSHIFLRNVESFLRIGKNRTSNLLIVTTAQRLPDIVKQFSAAKETIWTIAGVLLIGDQELPVGYRYIPQIPFEEDACLDFATRNVVDEVFIQIDSIQDNERFLKNMILAFERMGVVVNLNLDLFDLGVTGEKRIYRLEEYNVLAFASRLFDYRMVLLKRGMDIVGAIVGLLITFVIGIFLAPVLLLESPGPLIFCQKRVGVNGRTFNFYKFRSMYADAEARKKELMDQNEMSGLMFKMENDPRITKVGAFIRKTSIDELPQFWNVLKGDMSLVGTRPPTVDEYEQYNYYQKRRISFRPGITGLWQISGRSDIKDFDEVVKLDLEYIDNWSLMLDIKILIKTVVIVLKGKGAH